MSLSLGACLQDIQTLSNFLIVFLLTYLKHLEGIQNLLSLSDGISHLHSSLNAHRSSHGPVGEVSSRTTEERRSGDRVPVDSGNDLWIGGYRCGGELDGGGGGDRGLGFCMISALIPN